MVDPLQPGPLGNRCARGYSACCQVGGREPGRCKPAAETFVEHNVARRGVDVFNVVLDAPTHNGQRVDRVSGVDDPAGTVVGNRSHRRVNLQHVIRLAVVELDVTRRGKDTQCLPGIVGRNQGVNRRGVGRCCGYRLGLVTDVAGNGNVAGRCDSKRRMVLDGGQAFTRTGQRGDVAVYVQHGFVTLGVKGCGVKLGGHAGDDLRSTASYHGGCVGYWVDGDSGYRAPLRDGVKLRRGSHGLESYVGVAFDVNPASRELGRNGVAERVFRRVRQKDAAASARVGIGYAVDVNQA